MCPAIQISGFESVVVACEVSGSYKPHVRKAFSIWRPSHASNRRTTCSLNNAPLVGTVASDYPDFISVGISSAKEGDSGAVRGNRSIVGIFHNLLWAATQDRCLPKARICWRGLRCLQQQMRAVGKPACRNSVELLGQLKWPDFTSVNVPNVHARGVAIGNVLAVGRYYGGIDRCFAWVRRNLLLFRQ